MFYAIRWIEAPPEQLRSSRVTMGTLVGLLIGLAILIFMFQIDDKVVSMLDLNRQCLPWILPV